MTNISYITRFYFLDGCELTEEFFYNSEEEAVKHADTMAEHIGDRYEAIEVSRFNWETHKETSLHYYDE